LHDSILPYPLPRPATRRRGEAQKAGASE